MSVSLLVPRRLPLTHSDHAMECFVVRTGEMDTDDGASVAHLNREPIRNQLVGPNLEYPAM